MDKKLKIHLTQDQTQEALDVLPVAEAVYEAVKGLDDEQLMMVLGAVIDRWGAHHKLSSKDTFKILDTLASVQKDVHELIGPYEETKK